VDRKGEMRFVAVPLDGRDGTRTTAAPAAGSQAVGSPSASSPPAGKTAEEGPNILAAIDADLFKGNPFVGEKVFKAPGGIRLGYALGEGMERSEAAGVMPIVAGVNEAFRRVVPNGLVTIAAPGEKAKFVIFLVKEPCDKACVQRYGESFKGPVSLSFHFKSEDGRGCSAKAPVNYRTGEILGGYGIVDVTLPKEIFTYCMLQTFSSLIASSNVVTAAAFPVTHKIEGKEPGEIVREFILRPEKLLGLRLLYDESVKPGMTREEFWKAVKAMRGSYKTS
jgi:hypothetical protein